jgi:TRAP-type mannitol/chloroaromatic compound transport system permease small subunit
MPSRVSQAIDQVNLYVGNGVSLLFAPMTLIAVYEVAMRYLFNSPTTWAWDINVQLFCVLVTLGAGNTLLQKSHVIMDIVISRFSPRRRLLINMIVHIIFMFPMSIIVWQAALFAWRSIHLEERASTLLAPFVYPLKVGMLIGVSILLLQILSLILKDLLSFRSMSAKGEGR